jgi:hypothetical protein
MFILNSCDKDKLTGDLDAFEGRYTWEYSRYSENWWSSSLTTRQASDFNYTAEVEFNEKGKVIFYIDGKEIHKTGYKILEQNDVGIEGQTNLRIDPNIENTKELDLNDYIDLTLREDTLTMNDFPGESYDEDLGGTHFFIRN